MMLLVCTRKGLFALAREAAGWRIARTWFLGENVTCALADARDGAWYAALNLGHFGVKLHRSRDQGASWQEVAVPAYRAGDMVSTGDGKPPAPATLSLLWTLVAGGRDEPGRLWAGTIPGGLFRSDDAGDSWQLVASLWEDPSRPGWFGGGYDHPGIHSICVDPRDPRRLRVGISTGGVWRSDDGGSSWRTTTRGMFAEYMPPESREVPTAQDVHRLVQCESSGDALWVQHHNGVFASGDGGESWRSLAVPPSSFGFAVAVHPRDAATAWLVPAQKDQCRVPVDAKLVVARTRDGGKSFEVVDAGLPREPSFDLVYRHGLAVDDAGATLAMGSTTGGFWTSDDGGSRWQPLAARLPPVHAVAFA
ncbi:MAG TPA: sialidase family protein [Xanthomonadales bacterium]|nr:sialidase family protein [Xanthomonadales bacterium]